jgi:hypothetical protein
MEPRSNSLHELRDVEAPGVDAGSADLDLHYFLSNAVSIFSRLYNPSGIFCPVFAEARVPHEEEAYIHVLRAGGGDPPEHVPGLLDPEWSVVARAQLHAVRLVVEPTPFS